MNKVFFSLFFSLTTLLLSAEQTEIRVRLFSPHDLSTAMVRIKHGLYHLVAANKKGELVDTLWTVSAEDSNTLLHFRKHGAEVEVEMTGMEKMRFPSLWLLPDSTHTDPDFLIKGHGRERIYQDKIHLFSSAKSLEIINQVELEKYVAGVVESEGGRFNSFHFFKAQAVLARTFALKNMRKHIRDGYNLRDDVSSQVYHSRAYLQNAEAIVRATLETADSILVDEKGSLILSVFHANSGGQTANAQDVWLNEIPYLRSRPDPFSVDQTSYRWKMEIPKAKVHAFLLRELNMPERTADLEKRFSTFSQDDRKAYFEYANKRIPLKKFRTAFGLRSTYFSVSSSADNYIFTGKGYGHGVGLSQDGAINMSNMGFDFKEILYFYYDKISIKCLSEYYKEDEKVWEMVAENSLRVQPRYLLRTVGLP